MNEDKRNLEMASLLHSIGKFFKATKLSPDKKYNNYSKDDFGEHADFVKWSIDFINRSIDNPEIEDLVLHHNNPQKSKNPDLAKIIQYATWDSHGGKNKNFQADIGQLISIFSLINIENNKKCNEKYVPIKSIDLENWEELVPNSKTFAKKQFKKFYQPLWKSFEGEMSKIDNFDFNTVLSILYKFTSTIPISKSMSDISLYDYSKNTAALATCRYLYNCSEKECSQDEKIYLAISGDISGIQNFIFKLSSPKDAQSGMSKRLRGRSLYLTLLNEAIVDSIVENLSLTKANILFCGGGGFTIIAPNTSETKVKLNNIKNDINSYFIDEFNAELYFAISTQECSAKDLSEFGNVKKELSNKISEDKKHKFFNDLTHLFKIIPPKYEFTCPVCGNEYDGNSKVCVSCQRHEDLGGKAANSQYMVKYRLSDEFKNDSSLIVDSLPLIDDILNVHYAFFNDENEIKKFVNEHDKIVDKFEIIRLNNSDFLTFNKDFDEKQLEKISFGFSFMGNTIPQYPNRFPLYFEHLANISRGANKLGVLKMDVDNLGVIFSSGLKKSKSPSNISRVSTLSSQLDFFFSGIINKVAEDFVVYSSINSLNEDQMEYFDPIHLSLQDSNKKVTVYKFKDLDVVEKDKFKEERKLLKDYEIPTIYIDYSGGDDLLVLGPYDDIIKFAEKLNNSFKKWTCYNNSITLSAGINIINHKFPIGKAVQKSEEFLNASKSCGKDKITLFNETLDWKSSMGSNIKGFNDLFVFGKRLEELYSNGDNGVSKSFIYSLLHLWQYSYEKSSNLVYDKDEWYDNNLEKLRSRKYVPLFKYKLRLIKGDNSEEIKDELNKKVLTFMPWIRIPVSWVSLRTR